MSILKRVHHASSNDGIISRRMRKKRRKFFCLLLLGVTLLCYFCLLKNAEMKAAVSEVSGIDLLILSLFVLLTLLLNGIRTKLFLDCFNVPLSATEWFGLSVLTSMANYLPLRGGMAVKAVYLKKNHQFPYTLFLSSLTASYTIVFLLYGVIGIAASLLVQIRWGKFSFIVFFSFLALIILSALVFLLGTRFQKVNHRFVKPIAEVSLGLKRIRSDHRLLCQIAVLESLACFIIALRLYYAYRALSQNLPFSYCMILSPLTIVSTLVSITPAGLGIREFVIGAISKMIGHQFTEGIIVATLDRGVAMFWVFLLGSIFQYFTIGKIGNLVSFSKARVWKGHSIKECQVKVKD